VRVTILTNSSATTDLGVINMAARYAMKAFFDHYERQRDPERGAVVRYFEYLPQGDRSDGRSDRSLHSKVTVLGPDLLIGSANADVRSYMMDSNNGIYVRGAPQLVAAYTAWVESLLADATLTVERTRSFNDASLAQLLEEDRSMFEALLVDLLPDPATRARIPQAPLLDALEDVQRELYDLAVAILRGGPDSNAAAARFDSYSMLL
jgi:phosphatidylserine/phosphatidylglycerophosphate/cardiolipin synthase-like enzyme